MLAFGTMNIAWAKVHPKAHGVLNSHALRGTFEQKRGWVTVAGDVAGIVAGAFTEAIVFEIPLVNIAAPLVANHVVGNAVKKRLHAYLDAREAKEKQKSVEKRLRPSSASHAGSQSSAPSL